MLIVAHEPTKTVYVAHEPIKSLFVTSQIIEGFVVEGDEILDIININSATSLTPTIVRTSTSMLVVATGNFTSITLPANGIDKDVVRIKAVNYTTPYQVLGASKTIDGLASYTLGAANESVTLTQSTNWLVL